jgi:hypothetical protein
MRSWRLRTHLLGMCRMSLVAAPVWPPSRLGTMTLLASSITHSNNEQLRHLALRMLALAGPRPAFGRYRRGRNASLLLWWSREKRKCKLRAAVSVVCAKWPAGLRDANRQHKHYFRRPAGLPISDCTINFHEANQGRGLAHKCAKQHAARSTAGAQVHQGSRGHSTGSLSLVSLSSA